MCVFRYLELKQELVNLTFSEFTYVDEAMAEIGLVPQDIELKIPECYRYERRVDIEWKNKFIEETLDKMGVRQRDILGTIIISIQFSPDHSQLHGIFSFILFQCIRTTGPEMTDEEAIRLIQRHERARQYRIRAQFMKNTREMKNRVKGKQGEEISNVGRESALKIQRVWRGFITRTKIRKQVVDEMLLIGR